MLFVFITGCSSIKIDEKENKYYIKDWKCDKNQTLLYLFKDYLTDDEFWVIELKKDGTPKKCGEDWEE